MKKTLLDILSILFILKIQVLTTGCANIIPPTGGPMDSLPPVLVKANPPDSSREFKEKTISLTFDEYLQDIQQQNLPENLIVSPLPAIAPAITSKLKTITIKIKDTLEANTTYYYNFGKSIKDVNEGNVLKDFSYIFSTGSAFDSLELTGKVLLAETGGADSTLIVMLHKNSEDSAVAKETPKYIAKLDSSGNFRFRFLPPGAFYIYALKDDFKNYKYTDSSQLFAFADNPMEIMPGTPPITLFASAVEKKETPSTTAAPLTVNRTASSRSDERRLKFTTNTINNQQSILDSFILSLEQPLKNFDSEKLLLSTDTSYIPEKNYSWQFDSLHKKISLQITWKENTRYNLILDKEFAEDTTGRKLLKTDTISFTTKKLTDYGSVRISFTNLDLSKNPVLLFTAAGIVTNSYPLTSASFTQSLFNPGVYELRLFNDENKNGKWDPGDFWGKRKQPEIVKPIKEKMTIKANWDNEIEIVL